MDKELLAFFGAAKSVRLHASERMAVRAFLEHYASDHPVRVRDVVRHNDPMTMLSGARALTLSAREKDDGFDRIFRHMRRHPVRGMSVPFGERLSGFFAFHRMAAVAASFTLLCGMGGSLAYAAEYALPDDLLYDVKVHVTEPLREFVALTPEARTQWRLRRIERRLQEASALVQKERMDDVLTERVTANIEGSIASFERQIATMRENGEDLPDALILRYESLLTRHEHSLKTGTGSVRTRHASDVILQKVEQARVRSFGERMRDDQEDKTKALKHFNEHVVAPPRERLETMEDRIDEVLEDETLPPATRERLQGVRMHVEEAKEAMDRQEEEEGFFDVLLPLKFRSGSAVFLDFRGRFKEPQEQREQEREREHSERKEHHDEDEKHSGKERGRMPPYSIIDMPAVSGNVPVRLP